jgi:formylglycine-generating enzyme required for sulfatase activity
LTSELASESASELASELVLDLARLVQTLNKLDLTGREIAEALWLAARATQENRGPAIEVAATPVPESSEAPEDPQESEPGDDPEKPNPPSPPDPEAQANLVSPPVQTPSLALPADYKPLPVPDAPALSQPLQLARALRVLARQVAVGLPQVLDETATVESIAETGLWNPVLKPATELWLDVALVFDRSPSMCLWERLGFDLHRLLSRYGQFRDVRVWFLEAGPLGPGPLGPGPLGPGPLGPGPLGHICLKSRSGIIHKPSELLTGDRRRLIAIVSDCVGPGWHNGQIHSLIANWTAQLPTVVLQVFPERLWSRTALARSTTVEFQAKQPGSPSDRLRPHVRSYWDRQRLATAVQDRWVRLPVVSLELDVLGRWARMVGGDRRVRSLGIVWDARPATPHPPVPEPISRETIESRIDNFIMTASPLARQLATLLTAAPVITLPIARLIRQSMLREASSVHLAEVFMSGLLQVSGPVTSNFVPNFANAERVAYELVDESVRQRLQAGTRVVDEIEVINRVSAHVARGLGRSVQEFKALLKAPGRGESAAETAFLQAFATVTATILRGLGSEFAAVADELTGQGDEGSFLDEVPEIFPVAALKSEVVRSGRFTSVEVPDYLGNVKLDYFEFDSGTLQMEESLEEPDSESPEPPIDLDSTSTEPPAELDLEFPESPNDLQRFSFTTGKFPPEEGTALIRKQKQAWQYVETLTPGIDLEMVVIPGGTFWMGSADDDPQGYADEKPQHQVQVSDFWLGKYPVTQAQWRIVAGLEPVERDLEVNPSKFKGDNLPVELVSWYEVVEFCQRLSRETGRDYRLPNEAEWEYACRAGTQTIYCFGDRITKDVANYNGFQTSKVGAYGIANDFGLFDMHGNVWEWCADHRHRNYEGAPGNGSLWLSKNKETSRILRGGSWIFNPRDCRSAVRDGNDSGKRNNDIGFRVVCTPT